MLTPRELGAGSSAMFGGRFNAPLVGVTAPMVLVDQKSTYPTYFSALGLTRVYACEGFDIAERTPGALLDLLAAPKRWLSLKTWRDWSMTFVVLRPRGQVLPVSVDFGTGYGLNVTALHGNGSSGCWHWADVIAAVAEGANPADLDIVRVFSIVPVGIQPGLRPLRLPTGREVDLTREDLGRVLIDERVKTAATGPAWLLAQCKAFGNCLTYGNLARADATTVIKAVTMLAYGPSGEELTGRTRRPENAGPHQFLPAAASVCAGARLIMALARADIGARGGLVAAMHADSLTVLCSTAGGELLLPGDQGTVRVLPAAELREVLDQFAPLGVTFGWEIPDQPETTGLVIGVNRVVFARPDHR